MKLIDENFVLTDVGVSSSSQVICMFSRSSGEVDYAKDAFDEAFLKREAAFPIDLPISHLDVVVPHNNNERVVFFPQQRLQFKKSAWFFGLLIRK